MANDLCNDRFCDFCRQHPTTDPCCRYDLCCWPNDTIAGCPIRQKAIAVAIYANGDWMKVCVFHGQDAVELLCFSEDHDEEHCPFTRGVHKP